MMSYTIAQDLIERTQQNKTLEIVQKKADNPNQLAKLVAQTRKNAKISTTVDLFKFSSTKSAKTNQPVNIYQAGLSINSKAIIPNDINISYFSGDNILLYDGFDVSPKADFNAAIKNCGE